MKKKYIWVIFLLVAIFLYVTFKSPLKLKEKDLTLPVGEKYVEPGYKANKLFKNLNDQVKIVSNINPNKIGKYEVVYSLKYKDKEYQKIRKVKIVDTEKPQIILKGNKNTFVCANKTYEEEGFIATDNYDGVITDRVSIKNEKSKITYTVTDSSGNKATVYRNIKYGDVTKPKITIGEKVVKIKIGHPYYDGDYSATDNCDGDISKNVKIYGKVDTTKEGTYKLKYEVTDANNNKTIATKTFKVGNFNEKIIYLTFDDGPSYNITPKILDVLKEKNVKATFFVIGTKIDALGHITKRAYNEGHSIGLHSFTHDYQKIYQSEDNFWNDIGIIREKVFNITGHYAKIIRFPGGSSNTISRRYQSGIMTSLTKSVTDKGYIYFDWNVSSGDAGGTKDPVKIYKNVTANLKSGDNIVLMHDVDANEGTLNALSKIIDYGQKQGYTFEKITENTEPYHHTVNN